MEEKWKLRVVEKNGSYESFGAPYHVKKGGLCGGDSNLRFGGGFKTSTYNATGVGRPPSKDPKENINTAPEIGGEHKKTSPMNPPPGETKIEPTEGRRRSGGGRPVSTKRAEKTTKRNQIILYIAKELRNAEAHRRRGLSK